MAGKKNFWRPVWRSKNEKKAIAVLSDERKLLEVALCRPFPAERRQAAAGISDERLLAELALACGDGSLPARITRPDLLLKLALDANPQVSAIAFARLRKILTPEKLLTMLAAKAGNPAEKNMPVILQMLKAIAPDRWKSYCNRKTIDELLDLRYWRELPEISDLLWDFYVDDAFREIVRQAEEDYQNQKQQWEGEYNHILEMLFYQAGEKQNPRAEQYIQAMYDGGIYREYIEKRKAKIGTYHKWDNCICVRCQAKRDRDHDWDGCKCRRCGRERGEGHDWEGEILYFASESGMGGGMGQTCHACGGSGGIWETIEVSEEAEDPE